MKRSTFISLLALAAALTGLIVAAAAFVYRRRDLLCDDFDDELLDADLDYYASQVDEATPEQNTDAVDDACPLEHGLGGGNKDFYEEDEKTE